MKKVTLFFALLLLLASCQKEDTAWFIDNGWTEGIFEYGNTYSAIGMQIDVSGNINGIHGTNGYYYNHDESRWEFRLYSSFDQLKELTSAPSDGYIDNFLCDNTKCGVARKYYRSWKNGPGTYSWYGPEIYTYYKFYMRKINSYQFRAYVKEWYSESLD